MPPANVQKTELQGVYGHEWAIPACFRTLNMAHFSLSQHIAPAFLAVTALLVRANSHHSGASDGPVTKNSPLETVFCGDAPATLPKNLLVCMGSDSTPRGRA
jgi:hypothetical protein